MNLTQTLFSPLVAGLVASTTLPLAAQIQIEFSLSSQIEYRQNKQEIKFRGGSFDVEMTDGAVESIFFCNDPNYFAPGVYNGLCSPGTSGFLLNGSINGATIQRPYLVVTSLTPAFIVEPFKPLLVTLASAPASTLQRPSGGFRDDSASIFYNLNTTETEEFKITRYFFNKNYRKNDRDKFESEVVPGVYQYIFPGIVRSGEEFVFRPAPIAANVYPMVEGFTKKNNTEQGVKFTSVNNNKWNPDGFIELSYLTPNIIKWEGMDPTTVFAGVDSLYFSLRALRNPDSPEKSTLVEKEAIFPGFDNDKDSRVLLRNPYQNSFTVPPIFPSGTRAMVELQLQRNFKTGGVTYDFSSRKFQIPVIVVNRYTDYLGLSLANSNQKNLLSDPDGDNYNNLNEWILGSSGSDPASIPVPPTPADFQAETIIGTPTPFGSYFGFNVPIQRDTVPKVKYVLQRSLDQGKTWEEFKEGYYLEDGSFTTVPLVDYTFPDFPIILTPHEWGVRKVTTVVRGITYVQFEVRSGIVNTTANATIPTVQPPGALGDLYRVKIVLQKKKK